MSLLLEVVVGFGLLSTCMLLIFGLFPTSYTTMAVAKDRSLAINLARDKIEELRVAGFQDPQNSNATYPFTRTLVGIFMTCIINGVKTETEFKRQYTVEQLDTRIKHITVEISWVVGSAGAATGIQRNISLETYVTQH